MKQIIILLILFIPLTSAIQFSPASLEFELEKNQISCKKVNFEIETQATTSDIWAQNPSEQWKISNFKTSSQTLGIEIAYPQIVKPEQNEIEVCISSSASGNYKGALVFRQEEIGNSIIQFAVWLNVKIEGEPEKETDSKKSKSSGSSNRNVQVPQSSTSTPEKNFQDLGFNLPNEKIVLKTSSRKNPSQIPAVFAVALLVSLVIVFLFLLRRHR